MSNIEQDWLMLSRLGDSNAISSLLAKYKQMVKNITRKYFLVGGDQEDLMQEGMIGLYDAILSYDSSKNDHFERYAYLVVERHVLNAIKKASALKNTPIGNIRLDNQGDIELEDAHYSVPFDQKTPEETMLQQEQEKRLQQAIDNKLSDLEKSIVEEYLKGKSYQEIASVLQITPKSVDNALSRIKSKLSFLKEEKE